MNKQFKRYFKESQAWNKDDIYVYLINIFEPEEDVKTQKQFNQNTIIECSYKSKDGRKTMSWNVIDFKKFIKATGLKEI